MILLLILLISGSKQVVEWLATKLEVARSCFFKNWRISSPFQQSRTRDWAAGQATEKTSGGLKRKYYLACLLINKSIFQSLHHCLLDVHIQMPYVAC